MRAPAFWWRDRPGPAARLLHPAGALYGAVTARRMGGAGWRAPCPVICVGNMTVGGSGKTPAALAIAERLRLMGESPAFLSRGYGGTLEGPVQVDAARHEASQTGDEPLLLAQAGPTVVSRERAAGARLAHELGASVIIMDDGLQNPGLAKDLRLAVIDAGSGFGNGLVFPAGPLRARPEAQARHVDACLLVGAGAAGEAALARLAGLPVLRARLAADPEAAEKLRGRRVLALAGIGRPAKFIATLEEVGAVVAERHLVGDHEPYRPADLERLGALAERDDLLIVTTTKDRARLGGRLPPAFAARLATLPVTLRFDEPERMDQLLAQALARGRLQAEGARPSDFSRSSTACGDA